MTFKELQKYGQYSVILRQDDNGNPFHISPFVVACMPRTQDGVIVNWAFGHYFEDLFEAVNFARTKTEQYHPNYHRLCEIATKTIHNFIESDEDSAYEYLASEVELDYREAEYFGLNVELLENYK